MWLVLARLLLALFVIGLIFFLFRWSSAVRRDAIIAPAGQTVPDEWKVVIPEYAGGGRGSTLLALKPWRFGTMADHPIVVALCVAAAVVAGGAFAGCTWRAARLKRLNQPEQGS